MILNDKFFTASALPLIPYFVSRYSYIGLAKIYKNKNQNVDCVPFRNRKYKICVILFPDVRILSNFFFFFFFLQKGH
ncbi:hypothetical protein Hanom_Chr12g01114381 [Helianthus anomalus]